MSIPVHIRRFILTSIESVPHLEALLLFRTHSGSAWDARILAQNLFVNEKKAVELLSQLLQAGFLQSDENGLHRYEPATPRHRELIDELADIYAKNLIEITNLIHSNVGKQAQRFGDAFKWQDDEG